jgi:hypothetical protein
MNIQIGRIAASTTFPTALAASVRARVHAVRVLWRANKLRSWVDWPRATSLSASEKGPSSASIARITGARSRSCDLAIIDGEK